MDDNKFTSHPAAPRAVRGKPGQAHEPSRVRDRPPPINYIEYQFTSAKVNTTGDQVNVAYPKVKLVKLLTLGCNAAVVGISLSTSMTNLSAVLMGAFVIKFAGKTIPSTAPELGLGDQPPSLIEHTSFKNATTDAPVSINRTNGLTFGDFTAMKLNSGESLGIWVCAANSATDLIFASVSVVWFPIAL